MKFGKQLALGMYPPWTMYYLQYGRLKRIIKRKVFTMGKRDSNPHNLKYNEVLSHIVEKQEKQNELSKANEIELTESSSLLNKDSQPTYDSTKDTSINVIEDDETFFAVLESELGKINKFVLGMSIQLNAEINEILHDRSDNNRSHHSDGKRNELSVLKDIYIQLIALKKFCELNKTGFIKIVKKYDKIFDSNFSDLWKERLESEYFVTSEQHIESICRISSVVSRDRLLSWEMVELQQYGDGMDNHLLYPSVRVNSLLFSIGIFLVSFVLFNTNLVYTYEDDAVDHSPAKRCLSFLLLIISLWVSEAIPYFATALIIPIMITVSSILVKDTDPDTHSPVLMTRQEAANFVMGHLFNHTTVLILGGYTISSAFSRCELELRAASILQYYFGASPRLFMLAIMFLGLFLSMWISNHTAPILCTAILMPILSDLPIDSQYSKSLLLGLAFACNFGGCLTPISSLQNVIAMTQLKEVVGCDVTFGTWMMISIPYALCGTLITWFIINIYYPVDIPRIPIVVYDDQPLSTKSMVIIAVSCITCCLFAAFALFKDDLGDIGIVSLCYMVFMYGSGLLTEVDFNSLSWHTLMLLGGGNVLGKAVESSGLLMLVSQGIVKCKEF